jgi:hypothetical protein
MGKYRPGGGSAMSRGTEQSGSGSGLVVMAVGEGFHGLAKVSA